MEVGTQLHELNKFFFMLWELQPNFMNFYVMGVATQLHELNGTYVYSDSTSSILKYSTTL